jgi:hypothetical protein
MRRETADRARREEAVRVVERWKAAIAAGRDIWWSPAIRAVIRRPQRLNLSTQPGQCMKFRRT